MRKLKLLKSLGLGAMILLAVNFSNAQEAKPEKSQRDKKGESFDHTKMAKRQSAKLAEELQLNDATKAKVDDINKEFAGKMSKIEKERRENERTKIKALNEDREAKLNHALSNEEYGKYEAFKKERGEKFASKQKENKKKRGDFHKEKGPRKN
jgi:Spy/CpxP family protein refolding chaperone